VLGNRELLWVVLGQITPESVRVESDYHLLVHVVVGDSVATTHNPSAPLGHRTVRICAASCPFCWILEAIGIPECRTFPYDRRMKPVRVPLYGFPEVVLHADELSVKRHPYYQAAKAGDIAAADLLVAELASQDRTRELTLLFEGHTVELVPIHALESGGVNEIPAALAKRLSAWLEFPINDSIVQTNTVGHTGASGFQRLANQALFAGEVKPQQRYLVVDDFVGQGGTLANLIGFIASHGGHVGGATVLTGKPYSAKLAPDDSMIQALREKHGQDLEDW
jgi:hypothetical protein